MTSAIYNLNLRARESTGFGPVQGKPALARAPRTQPSRAEPSRADSTQTRTHTHTTLGGQLINWV